MVTLEGKTATLKQGDAKESGSGSGSGSLANQTLTKRDDHVTLYRLLDDASNDLQ